VVSSLLFLGDLFNMLKVFKFFGEKLYIQVHVLVNQLLLLSEKFNLGLFLADLLLLSLGSLLGKTQFGGYRLLDDLLRTDSLGSGYFNTGVGHAEAVNNIV
jgi:hypothetical protein